MIKHSVVILMFGFISVSGVPIAQAEQQGFWSWMFTMDRMKEVEPMTSELYKEECGSCHFAYPAGLLPEKSWKKLMQAKALGDHFGENAELEDEDRLILIKLLSAKSADKSRFKRSRKVMASLDTDESPLRITDVPYIKEKHEEVTEEVLKTSKKVKSLSYCEKCHQQAEKARFDDDTVVIPDHGTWTW